MNNRIYKKELFEKEVLRILLKKYCYYCYSENDAILSMKTINDPINCINCGKETTLVNKEEVRNLKIERVVKK